MDPYVFLVIGELIVILIIFIVGFIFRKMRQKDIKSILDFMDKKTKEKDTTNKKKKLEEDKK